MLWLFVLPETTLRTPVQCNVYKLNLRIGKTTLAIIGHRFPMSFYAFNFVSFSDNVIEFAPSSFTYTFPAHTHLVTARERGREVGVHHSNKI